MRLEAIDAAFPAKQDIESDLPRIAQQTREGNLKTRPEIMLSSDEDGVLQLPTPIEGYFRIPIVQAYRTSRVLNVVPLPESAALDKVDWSPEWHPNHVRIASANECFNFGTEACQSPRETIQSQMYSCTSAG